MFSDHIDTTCSSEESSTQSSRSAGGTSPSDSGQDDVSEGSPKNIPTAPSPALILPDVTPINDTTVSGVFKLPENANPMQAAAWLRANGLQRLEATFKDFSGHDFQLLTRKDLIEICGRVDGIYLYNLIHLRPVERKLYFSMESDGMDVWKVIYLSNFTSEALTLKITEEFDLSYNQLQSTWVRIPYNKRIVMTNEVVEHMEDSESYLIEIIKDSPNDNNFNLLLKPFNPEKDAEEKCKELTE